MYSAVLTENAWDIASARLGRDIRLANVRYTYTSVFDALADQLRSRKRGDFSFDHFDRRVRFSAGIQAEVSFRNVTVANKDSIDMLSGVSYEPFSAWDLDVEVPLTMRNRYQECAFVSRIKYSGADEKVGHNTMDFRFDYSVVPEKLFQPYSSGGYRTYVHVEQDETMRVRARGAVGLQTTPGDWKFKLGFATEKQHRTTKPSPFEPFIDLFNDTSERWGPGMEAVLEGRYDIADPLQKVGVSYFDRRELMFRLEWDNYYGTFLETAKLESDLELGLEAQVLPNLKLRLGYRFLYARLMKPASTFINTEPSLSLVGTYALSW
jgi:hypothetical protein